MNTRQTLLRNVVDGQGMAWVEFDALYRPMLLKWLKADPLSGAEAEDVVQEVMLFTLEHLADFAHNGRPGAFRRWLRLTAVNIARNHLRRTRREQPLATHELGMLLEGLADADSSVSRAFDLDVRRAALGSLLQRVGNQFQGQTMALFRCYVLDQVDVDETARRFDVSKASVYVAKSRVLAALRAQGADWRDELLDD